MSDTVLRQISMLELIPRYPAKTFTNEIKDKLENSRLRNYLKNYSKRLT